MSAAEARIRTFRIDDTADVVRLWRVCGLVVPQNDPEEDIRRKIESQPDLFLVAVDGGRVVATVMAGYEGHRGWLNYVAVDPEHRRAGLGRRIVAEAEERLRRMGSPKVNLQVRRSNLGVMEFYRRVGYVEDDVAAMGKRFPPDKAHPPAPFPATSTLGQPVGAPFEFRQPPPPPRSPIHGAFGGVTPLEPQVHAADLWSALAEDREGRNWTYLAYGPFAGQAAFEAWMNKECLGEDPLFHAIVDRRGRAAGIASYLRIQPAAGVIEVGHLNFSPRLQRTPAATEAMYLMMKRAFELGYRRYEWKCDSLNAPSRAAALRLGFTYEGTFRQATHYKGRNRDTAWFSILDREWPALSRTFEGWLDPSNFDTLGAQRRPLGAFRES